MKKILISCIWALSPALLMADDTPSLVISTTDGNSLPIDISTILSIKFKDGAMLINATDGSHRTISLDDVSSMSFSTMASAIRTVVGDDADSEVVVSDLTGRRVFVGTYQQYKSQQSLHGVYIVTTASRSYKVIIK